LKGHYLRNGIMSCCFIYGMSGKRQHFVNVVGQYEDVICDYRTCRHKLSEHGSSNRKCRCRHPSNKAIGINFS